MTYDLAVVGGGILGLAHAWQGARAGLRVAVFERNAYADGASVRNFGMLAIAAQQPGPELQSARASLAAWQEVAESAGISLRQAGCLFVARRPEEMDLLVERAAARGPDVQDFALIGAEDLACHAPGLKEGALGALYSPEAWKADQRGVPAAIAAWLARDHGVTFHFGTEVIHAGDGQVETTDGHHAAGQIVICGGNDFARLCPDAWTQSGVSTCRLQMLRTAPQPEGWRLKPFVMGGLSMARYTAFANCDALPALRAVQSAQMPEAVKHNVHVIIAQEDDGSITLGDSHHYGAGAAPDDPAKVDDLILAETDALMTLPERRIAARWVGNYAHLSGQSLLRISPCAGVTAVTVTNGQGMTHGFAVAAETIANLTA
ncbi:TIGR03364 family FAD-dependent oxidoreductase [Roseovarius nanhaiticus]|uniref:TIGR03364 family FAD-dependent oxidoreductase n=1 Tax=Roseovarius nanhaiticus TaxID=573024 RepID=UPI002491805A|nr:TIGR03364 family FAD-dependent oxidoreductase [Roseovarius nanhaiticus]